LAAAVLSPCVVGGVPVAAQEAAEDGADGAGDAGRPVADAGSAAWTKVEAEAKGYGDPLKAGGAFDGAARDFVSRKAMPQLASPANRSIIDRVRRRLREILLGGITDERAFEDASKAVAEGALAIVRNRDSSRVARVNAALLIGELRGKDGREGTAWAPAVSLLAGVAGDAAVDPSVRVAALAGLVRHAEAARRAGGDALGEFAKSARPAILGIVAEPVPAEASVVADWMVSRALSLVTSVVKSSPKDLAATLTGVMNDGQRSLDVRIRAAAALGATVTPKSEIQAVEAVGGIRQLAIAALEADEGILRDRRYEQQLGGGGPAGGGAPMGMSMRRPPMGPPGMAPGMPGMPGMPGEMVPQLVPDQILRRTAWRLVTLADAILTEDGKTGVATLLSGADKAGAEADAKLFREHGLAIDKTRTDNALIEALASLRPDVEAPATAAVDDAGEPATEKPADDSDPFGGK
jgi:hypothetical protein